MSEKLAGTFTCRECKQGEPTCSPYEKKKKRSNFVAKKNPQKVGTVGVVRY
jgi:hypothetical protein